MAITGAHSILYTTNADADRAFLRDVLKLPNVDVGEGWLIFGLPPAEVAVHPANDASHELYLMCDDAEAFVSEMTAQGIACEPVQNRGWGLVTTITLPGGSKLGVYEPRHARPESVSVGKAGRKQVSKRSKSKKTPARAKARTKKTAGRKVAARSKASGKARTRR